MVVIHLLECELMDERVGELVIPLHLILTSPVEEALHYLTQAFNSERAHTTLECEVLLHVPLGVQDIFHSHKRS